MNQQKEGQGKHGTAKAKSASYKPTPHKNECDAKEFERGEISHAE
jgi:hypothetical protein